MKIVPNRVNRMSGANFSFVIVMSIGSFVKNGEKINPGSENSKHWIYYHIIGASDTPTLSFNIIALIKAVGSLNR